MLSYVIIHDHLQRHTAQSALSNEEVYFGLLLLGFLIAFVWWIIRDEIRDKKWSDTYYLPLNPMWYWRNTMDEVYIEKRKRKVFIASSWKNPDFDTFIQAVKDIKDEKDEPKYDVYNFKENGFDLHDRTINKENFWEIFHDDATLSKFASDMGSLNESDVVILLLPSGKSSHLELGYACGKGAHAYVVLNGVYDPEFTYLMCNRDTISNHIVDTPQEMIEKLKELKF